MMNKPSAEKISNIFFFCSLSKRKRPTCDNIWAERQELHHRHFCFRVVWTRQRTLTYTDKSHLGISDNRNLAKTFSFIFG